MESGILASEETTDALLAQVAVTEVVGAVMITMVIYPFKQGRLQIANRSQMMHHLLTHHTASQAQVATTAHRTDKPGGLVSGPEQEQELLQVPLQDTWPETEQVARAAILTDRTAEDGEVAPAQALLHHHRRDTRALVLAHRAADKTPSKGFL